MPIIPQRINLRFGTTDPDVGVLKKYLHRFGYFAGTGLAVLSGPGADDFDQATASALRRYQRFHGLAETGILDAATVNMMARPRCGIADIRAFSGGGGLMAAFTAVGKKWGRTDLTYSIENTPANLTRAQVATAIVQAFNLWAAVTPLRFSEVAANASPDIRIRFAAGDHGDGSPFDGVGVVLAHAFYPPPNGGDLAGDAHFDSAETWTVNVPTGNANDLVTVAAHEFGHSLGLDHSSVSGALMFPTYSGPHRFLAADDIEGIQSIYGTGFLLQTGTALHETDADFTFLVASNLDLFAIKRRGTGSNRTEVHVLSAAHHYQAFRLQTGTALHETDGTFAFCLAPNRDLVAIKKSGTGTHSTEVHVLSASSGYQQFSVQTGTPLHETDGTFVFCVGPKGDLYAIKRSGTGTKSTEVHVLSGESNYQQFVLQTGTALHETDENFAFAVAPNRDVFAIKKSKTGTNSTEVHVLSAADNYQRFSLQRRTALHETDGTFEFGVTPQRDLFAVKKSAAGTNSTEVHIVDLPA